MRKDLFSDQKLMAMVDDLVKSEDGFVSAAHRDIRMWSKSDRCAFFECCRPEDNQSFEMSVYHLKQWLVQRSQWIDSALAQGL